MSRPPKMPRNELLDILTAEIIDKGYDGVSLADFSAASGLSKASLYHFFAGGKDDIAQQALIRSGMKLQKWVIAPLQGRATAADRINASLDGLSRYYNGPRPACLMNILSLSTSAAKFTESIDAGIKAWTEALKLTFLAMGKAEPEAIEAAQGFFRQVQGALVLCRVYQSRDPLDQVLAGFRQ